MSIIHKHIARVLPRQLDRALEDPRRCERRWSFSDLMQAAFHAMVAGCKNYREIERLTEASGRRVPDTTLHDLLVQLDAEPLEEELARGVKAANRNHELDDKELPFNLVVIDGKSVSTTTCEVDGFSINRSQKGTRKYVQHIVRAFHASSRVKLLMGQQRVPQGTNEKGVWSNLLEKLIALYGRTNLLDVFSFDAGFTSTRNGTAVVDAGYNYIFAIKDPRVHTITRVAMALLASDSPPVYRQEETVNGEAITRSLYRCAAPQIKGWEHAQELWRVHKVRVHLRTGKMTYEDHYYVTSVPSSRLADHLVLKTIRMHWSIENNANWVMDVAWKEDQHPWCNAAIEVISLMRMIAYNLVARFKLRRLACTKAHAWTWEQTLHFIKAALFPLNEQRAFATR